MYAKICFFPGIILGDIPPSNMIVLTAVGRGLAALALPQGMRLRPHWCGRHASAERADTPAAEPEDGSRIRRQDKGAQCGDGQGP